MSKNEGERIGASDMMANGTSVGRSFEENKVDVWDAGEVAFNLCGRRDSCTLVQESKR